MFKMSHRILQYLKHCKKCERVFNFIYGDFAIFHIMFNVFNFIYGDFAIFHRMFNVFNFIYGDFSIFWQYVFKVVCCRFIVSGKGLITSKGHNIFV